MVKFERLLQIKNDKGGENGEGDALRENFKLRQRQFATAVPKRLRAGSLEREEPVYDWRMSGHYPSHPV